jgi:hypothetical protein
LSLVLVPLLASAPLGCCQTATPVLFSPQQSTNLASIQWLTLTNSPTTIGATCQLAIPTFVHQTFYRLASQ